MCHHYLNKGVRTIQLALVEPNGRAKDNFKEFIPKMEDALPEIIKALELGNGKVKVKNIPKCLLGEYYEQEFFPTQNYIKLKIPRCKECKFDSECFGIWKDYIDIYGYEELQPIK